MGYDDDDDGRLQAALDLSRQTAEIERALAAEPLHPSRTRRERSRDDDGNLMAAMDASLRQRNEDLERENEMLRERCRERLKC